MKSLLHAPNLRQFPVTCLAVLACTCFPAAFSQTASPQDTTSAAALQRLQDQLEQQTKRIDRLYRVLGPNLEEMEERAAVLEKQQQEDKALALEQIREVADETLTGIGSVSPTAAEFAVITDAGAVRIFDAGGKAVKELQQSGQKISCLAFSPGGHELLTGTRSGALLVWDVAKNACSPMSTNVGAGVGRVTWLGNDRVAWGPSLISWKEDGKSGDHEKPAGTVLVRATGQRLWAFHSFVRDDFVTLTAAMNGQQLVVLEIPDQPRGAFLLDGATGKVLHTCYDEAHGAGPLSVGISPDGNTLAVGYAPYDIVLWNARTGERQKLLKGHSNWVVSLAFSADNKRLISGAGDSTARIWDVESGKETGRIRLRGESTYVNGVGLAPKGDTAFAVARGVLIIAKPR